MRTAALRRLAAKPGTGKFTCPLRLCLRLAVCTLLLASCTPYRTPAPEVLPPALPAAPPAPTLDFLGAVHLPSGSDHAGTRVGGLSALAWEASTGEWLALSDDRSEHAPARLYTLSIGLGDDGRFGDDDVAVTGVTTLTDADGRPYAVGTVDPEGLAVTAGGTLLVSSEGIHDLGRPPFVQEHGRDGAHRRAFAVPERFHQGPAGAAPRGVRNNQGFEALSLAPGGGTLWAGAEGPLVQDGDEPGLGVGAFARIVRFDAVSGRPLAEHLYPLDPLPVGSWPPEGLEINGLVELLALGGDDLLALERAYVAGRGTWLRVYRVSVAGADDVSGIDALAELPDDAPPPRPVEKHLVADLANLGLPLFNTEAMALGPELPDGRRLLVLVSDDNFTPLVPTQLLAFAVDPAALPTAPPPRAIPSTIAEVQGAAHTTPLAGRRVVVEGTVTAVARDGFWLQDPRGDGDPATSEGVFVATWGSGVAAPAPGDHLRVTGRAMERGRGGAALSLTSLAVGTPSGEPDGAVALVAAGEGLVPGPVRLGAGTGTDTACPPGPAIDDDRLRRFEPFSDGADFWESLEGMRLSLAAPTVVGPTSRFGEIVLVAEGCVSAPRTVHGGLLLRPGDDNPERLVAAGRLAGRAPSLAVGDRFATPLVGVLDFDFDDYRLQAEAWPEVVRGAARPQRVAPAAAGAFAAATFNVENLSARDGDRKFASLAESLVDGLGSPALVALQEVQDDSGGADDGTVAADATLARLVAAVEAAGGPRYEAVEIAPENNLDGGRPGGNIRTAFLYDPAVVELVRRGAGGPQDGVAVERGPDGVRLTLSPGRVAPNAAAWERSRKPLAAEFRVGGAAGRTLFAVNLHLGSKGGDDALFAAVQPPRRPTEVKRNEQARLVADFAAGLLAADPEAWVLVLGDLNEFPFRPPVQRFREAGLVDLMDRLPVAERYTYVYEGNAQVLDHVLVSPALGEAVVGTEVAHRNADFPVGERSSDHDPVVVGFRLP
ncbi:MAG TPA: esterase-like activity of phytase family protein [Thermoanaerobaculia bacterium]|nr:esterase-like activity of phytase family protein [Thermoanaerobaculia bacterium]